jgi:hypothetical protein
MQNAESSDTAPNLGQANVAAGGSATTTGEMRSVGGELQGKLDSKSARVGETVMVKTTEKIRMADGTVIPKGSRLLGHVTQVQAHDSDHTESSLAFAFDRAEMKCGQTIDIGGLNQMFA